MAATLRKSSATKTRPPKSHSGDPAKSARDRIVESAGKLFYAQGSRAVGIDTVIADSGVAKMSLYRNFRSKDELIGAWLADVNEGYWQRFDRSIALYSGNPREQLCEIFRALAERSCKPGYRGCPFLNTALDYSESHHPGRKISVKHKQTLAARLLRLCKQLGVVDPQALSRQLVLLVNGAQATAGMLGPGTQHEIIHAADILIDSQLKKAKK
jgi:AcrR family transcriptional regulator